MFPHKTGLGDVVVGPMTMLRMRRWEAEARAMALLDKVGLADKGGSFPAGLSGG